MNRRPGERAGAVKRRSGERVRAVKLRSGERVRAVKLRSGERVRAVNLRWGRDGERTSPEGLSTRRREPRPKSVPRQDAGRRAGGRGRKAARAVRAGQV